MERSGTSSPLVSVEELARRAHGGDAVAIERLVRERGPYVGRICGAIALEAGDDAMQDTMIAVVTKIHTLREPAAIRGWVRRIAVRESTRVARRSSTTSVDPEDLASIGVDDESNAVDVAETLRTMPADQRAVLVLRHLDGLSEQETAEVLGVAVGTVKSRLHRARADFRRRWTS